ncbi:uncharacterized protein N7498_010689 [Penicillium cinerascens]|uniref:Uncharacterized protein n=1 Tax=Penicillium cinerascens TaxID=70096 RepID=A0A9W9J8G0_9EURO|nr:uncharacterized protein N7498_010689 [Penicillium cinerascens]KAJ5191704.1 hypothetical protein N7498_010689 [Penicillium cinerascens]
MSPICLASRAERIYNRTLKEKRPINFTAENVHLLIQHFRNIHGTKDDNPGLRNALAIIAINRKHPDMVQKMYSDIGAGSPKGYASLWSDKEHIDEVELEISEELEIEDANGVQGPPWILPADPSSRGDSEVEVIDMTGGC